MRKGEYFLEALNYVDDKYIEEARYNTMKKRFNFKPIIAVAACAAIAIAAIPVVNNFVNATPAVQVTTGAQNTPTESRFKVYEYDLKDDPVIGEHKIDSPLNKRIRTTINAKKQNSKKTIEVFGTSIETTYELSYMANDYVEAQDKYAGVINGKKIKFKVDPETGKCTEFLILQGEDVAEKKLTRDELYEIAFDFFKKADMLMT